MDVDNMLQADCILLELIHVFENDAILEEKETEHISAVDMLLQGPPESVDCTIEPIQESESAVDMLQDRNNMAEEKQEKHMNTYVANYSKKRIFTCEYKEERIHEYTHRSNIYGYTLNVEYGYGVPFRCWCREYKPEDVKEKDFDIITHKVIENKNNATAYIHDNEDENEPSKYPLLIDINNGEFGFLLPRRDDKDTYEWIQYDNINDNIKYPARPVNGYNNKKSGRHHAFDLDYSGNIDKNEGCVTIKIEYTIGYENKKQWGKSYTIKAIEYTELNLRTFYSEIKKAKQGRDKFHKIEVYYHDKYPDTFPLLIVIPLKVTFLVPSAGDERDFSFLYKKENNGSPPNDFDCSLEGYVELTACCDSLEQLKTIWTSKKDVLKAGGSHFLCIVFKNADLNGIKYIMENGGAGFLNTKSHLDRYPFDEIYDWNYSISKLKEDTIAKDKIKYVIKMGSSMCWDAFFALQMWEKEICDLYIEMVQNADFDNLRDDQKSKEQIGNMAMAEATTIEQIQRLISKGIKPQPVHLILAFQDNDNERIVFFSKNVDINQTNDKGNTFLTELCEELCEDSDMLEFLNSKDGLQVVVLCLKNGADPTITNAAGKSAFSLVQTLCEKNETEILKRILHEMKLSMDHDDYALHDNEIFDKEKAKEYIDDNEMFGEKKEKENIDASHSTMVTVGSNDEIDEKVEVCTEKQDMYFGCTGPDKESDKPGFIDIFMAFMMNDSEQLAFLLNKMDINQTFDNGNTALHHFCQDRNMGAELLDSKDGLRMVAFCLKHGADPTIKNAAGDSALSLVQSLCEKKESEMLKRVLYEMKSSIDDDYALDYDDEIFIQRWKCAHCDYRNNLINNIVCKKCKTERIVDLTLFDELISIKEIGAVLFALIDCIALNSLIQLDLLTLTHFDALFSTETRKSRYLKEMQDRLIKTMTDDSSARNVLHVTNVKVVCLSKEINLNIDDMLTEVMSDSNLRNIIAEWKNEIGNSQKTQLQICKDKLLNKRGSNNFAEIYPLNKSFSLQDEQCIKFIVMCIAFKQSKFYFGWDFKRLLENTKWNYGDILRGYCKLLIKQDLLNEYKENQYFAPSNMTNMKHKFEHFYLNEQLSERDSLCVHAAKVQNILNYCNEYKHKMNAKNQNQCLSEARFGELLFNDNTEYNEQYEIDGNMLKDISQKILLERFVGDTINEWYCLDFKKMQSDGDRYENSTFSNYFYGILSQKVRNDMVYEIEFVESVVSYYYNYMS